MASVAFLHAHPDDEAIFTGGTMAALAAAGHRVILVVATGGELGLPHGDDLARARSDELRIAAEELGATDVHLLGHGDSGLAGDPANQSPGSLWSTPIDAAAGALADLLSDTGVETLVLDDPGGIYGHPDHVQCNRIGHGAADRLGLATRYETTVDREYLHFVETHLVEVAALAGDLGLVRSHIGSATVEIDLTLDVRGHLGAKRAAMAAHRSQLPEHAPVFALDDARFAQVYGWEWFRRLGPRGPLDELLA